MQDTSLGEQLFYAALGVAPESTCDTIECRPLEEGLLILSMGNDVKNKEIQEIPICRENYSYSHFQVPRY